MTPPIEPTAAEREGGPLTPEEALFARILDLRHWTSNSAGAEKRHDCKCEDCKAIKQIVHLARQAVATSQSKRAKQLAEMEAALLAARREVDAVAKRARYAEATLDNIRFTISIEGAHQLANNYFAGRAALAATPEPR